MIYLRDGVASLVVGCAEEYTVQFYFKWRFASSENRILYLEKPNRFFVITCLRENVSLDSGCSSSFHTPVLLVHFSLCSLINDCVFYRNLIHSLRKYKHTKTRCVSFAWLFLRYVFAIGVMHWSCKHWQSLVRVYLKTLRSVYCYTKPNLTKANFFSYFFLRVLW